MLVKMKDKQEAIMIPERISDNDGVRSVLRDWGYREGEIRRFLDDEKVQQEMGDHRGVTEGPFSGPNSLTSPAS